MLLLTGTSFGDNPNIVDRVRLDARLRQTTLIVDNKEIDSDGHGVGTWGIKSDYVQNTPAAIFPPTNYKKYAKMLVFDQFVKALVADSDDKEKTIPKENVPSIGKYAFPTAILSSAIISVSLGINPSLNEVLAMTDKHDDVSFFSAIIASIQSFT